MSSTRSESRSHRNSKKNRVVDDRVTTEGERSASSSRSRSRSRSKSISRSRSRSRSPSRSRSKRKSSKLQSSRSRRSKHRKASKYDRSRSQSRSRSSSLTSTSRSRSRSRSASSSRSRSRSRSYSRSRSRSRSPERSRKSRRHNSRERRYERDSKRDKHDKSDKHRDRGRDRRIKHEDPDVKPPLRPDTDRLMTDSSATTGGSSHTHSQSSASQSSATQPPTRKIAYGAQLDIGLEPAAGGIADTPFVWKKKIEKMVERGEKVELTRAAYQAKLEANREDLIKLRERKTQRETEKLKNQQLREEIQKGLELEANLGWEDREEEFHRKQSLLRSEIRLREGRERAIDLLMKNIHILKRLEGSQIIQQHQLGESATEAAAREKFLRSLEVDAEEPSRLVIQLKSLEALSSLKSELVRLVELGDHVDDYWLPLLIVCNNELDVAHRTKQLQREFGSSEAEDMPSSTHIEALCAVQGTRVQPALVAGMDAMLAQRSLASLDELEKHVSNAMRDANSQNDAEYWEVVARRLVLRRAIATLQKFHTKLLKRRLAELRREAQLERERANAREIMGEDGLKVGTSQAELDAMVVVPETVGEEGVDNVQHTDAPAFLPLRALSPEERRLVITHEEDVGQRAALLHQIHEHRVERMIDEALGRATSASIVGVPQILPTAAAASTHPGLPSGLDEFEGFEEPMPESDMVALPSTSSSASLQAAYGDKYRPRKPRFINKVRTGFDWTKYNQAHYDKDNPPPRVVQGYRFNIFYPDLIDPTKTPTYRLEPDPEGNPDMCIIRFKAGPPYEDLAFKIVKKKWNTSRKHGFKCVFHKGVLSLSFNFMRVFYRR